MHHWSIIDAIYIYDGTIEGLLTAIYKCFEEKTIPKQIMLEEEYIGNLFDQPLFIESNTDKSNYLLNAIQSKISDLTLYYVYTAFLSGDINRATSIMKYVIYAFKYGRNINYMKSLDCVIEIQRICKNVTGEAHRFLGFIRFRELSNAFLYAEYESDNNILGYLAEHFRKRLKQEIWMIHDKKRDLVALYNRDKYVIVDATTLDISLLENSHEDMYLILWKDYFKNISIKERENKRCQMHFMPKKYWKYLPET
ncbi:MAG: TIGR03915 family putative DNA repair protein [Coprobacillaceae bacterium]